MRAYWTTFAGVVIGALVAFAVAIVLANGTVISDQHDWARRAVQLKRDLVADVGDQNKLLVMAGSSALFGIRARLLEVAAGMPARNMAVQGSMGIRSMVHELKLVARPGDVILLAPEPQMLWTDDLDNDFSISIALQLPNNHVVELPPFDLLNALRMLPISRILEGAARRFVPPGAAQPGYDLTSIDRWGDFTGNTVSNSAALERLVPEATLENTREAVEDFPCEGEILPKPRALSHFLDFVAWARSNDIEVFVTPYNVINLPSYRAVGIVCEERSHVKTLENAGVEVVGTYQDSLIPLDHLYDTFLHPNALGAAERTKKLIASICRETDLCVADWQTRVDQAGI